jgi:predicted permease
MEQATLIINRLLPILILLGLGYCFRRRQFVDDDIIEGLKKLAVTLALPSVLFISFLEVDFDSAYVGVFVLMFLLCLALFGLGFLIKRMFRIQQSYFPFLITGFEYGMLGVSLFGGAYGLDKVGYIAIVDLGHEIFIWFVFLAALLIKRDALETPIQLFQTFFKSPVVFGILAGTLLNLFGAREFMYERPVTGAIMATLQFLSTMTIPLILIPIGYGISLDHQGLKQAIPVTALRLMLLIPLGLLVSRLLRGGLNLSEPFAVAVFVLFILPPSFLIPLYIPPEMKDERQYVNNALMLYTIISIVVFAVYFIFNPQV